KAQGFWAELNLVTIARLLSSFRTLVGVALHSPSPEHLRSMTVGLRAYAFLDASREFEMESGEFRVVSLLGCWHEQRFLRRYNSAIFPGVRRVTGKHSANLPIPQVTGHQLTEDIAKIGGDVEVATLVELLLFQPGPFAPD